MNQGYEQFEYDDYNAYLVYQALRGSKSQKLTRKYKYHRTKIINEFKAQCPKIQTVLCLGARSSNEVNHFEWAGYETTAIDVFEADKIIKCDMTDIEKHPDLKDKYFDAFVAIHSLEHCLDIETFKKKTLPHCRIAFGIVMPMLSSPTQWDCLYLSFIKPDPNYAEIEAFFPGFKVIYCEFENNLRFILKREI
jgi:hypothetical protein